MLTYQAVTDLLKPLQIRIRQRKLSAYVDPLREVEDLDLEKRYLRIILALSESVDASDPDGRSHALLTNEVACALATRVGLTEIQVEDIRWAALLHDVGKIEVPAHILKKPAPLNDEEWKYMRKHPEIGARLLAPIEGMSRVASIVLAHHEKFDGTGYPYGLAGEQIPVEARILALADAYSVMVTGRVYCEPRSFEETAVELKRCSGTHFDPLLVDEFIGMMAEGGFCSL